MAAPVFVASEVALKSALRLTAVPASSVDTEAIIDEAILRARHRLYTDLGAAQVTLLLTYNDTTTPTTDNEILRSIAASVEIKIVRCILLRELPNTFLDASGDQGYRHNEEAPTRERGGLELDDELRRCEEEIVADMERLASTDGVDCDELQIWDGTPERQTSFPENTPRVGLSLRYPTGTNLPQED